MKTYKMIVIIDGHTFWLCFPEKGMRGAFRRMYPGAEYRHIKGRALDTSKDHIWESRLYISLYFAEFLPVWDEAVK